MAQGSTINQYFAAIVLHIASFDYGLSVGWTSPIASLLKSSETPLDAPLSDSDMSWVGGFLVLGGILGTLVFMCLVNVLGRKMAGFLLPIPCLIQWILILEAKKDFYLYIARFLGGFSGGGSFVVAPVMVAEFAEDHVRGRLELILILAQNSGILFAYIIGSVVSYDVVAYVMIAFPITHALLLTLIPETPVFLLKSGKPKDALESLKWYRGLEKSDKVIVELEAELEKIRQENTKNKSVNTDEDTVSIKDFFTPLCLRGMTIGIGLMVIQQASGLFAILSYATTVFQEAGSSISPNISAIIVGTLLVVGTYVSTLLVERAGRKFLLIASCLGTGICLFVLATYTQMRILGYDTDGTYGWVPVSSLSICVLVYAFGLAPVPYVVAAEIFSPKVRGIATPICVFSVWVFAFLILKFYNNLSGALGAHGSEYLFSGCMALGAIFVWLVIPETKGRPIEDILEDLMSSKKKISKEITAINTTP